MRPKSGRGKVTDGWSTSCVPAAGLGARWPLSPVSDPTSFPLGGAETIMRTIELGVTITAAVDGASNLSLPPFRYMSRTPAGWGHVKALPVIDMSAPVCCGAVAARAAQRRRLRCRSRCGRRRWLIRRRVKIMSLLFSSRTADETSGDLATVLDLTESTVSQHLGQLPKAGLVISDRRGMNVFHRVKPEALQALCVVLDPNCCR